MLNQFEAANIAEPASKPAKMAKNFSELRTGMNQAARERSEAQVKVMLAELPLNELDWVVNQIIYTIFFIAT